MLADAGEAEPTFHEITYFISGPGAGSPPLKALFVGPKLFTTHQAKGVRDPGRGRPFQRHVHVGQAVQSKVPVSFGEPAQLALNRSQAQALAPQNPWRS